MPLKKIEIFLSEALSSAVAFDQQQANLAINLHAQNRDHCLSYVDAACIALGMHRNIPVLTAYRKWSTIPLGVEVKLIP